MDVNFLYVLLAALLAILTPSFIDRIRKHYQIDDTKRGILTELKDVRARLAQLAYTIASRLGRIDRQLLTWLAPVLREYRGTEPIEASLKSIENQLSMTEEQLAEFARLVKFQPDGALSLKTFALPFLESNMNLLSLFPMDFQNRVFEIRAHLSILNQEIDQSAVLFLKTFDSEITEENQLVIRANIYSKYEAIEGASRRLADKIGSLVSKS